MAMDHFMEEVVTKKSRGLSDITFVLAWIMMILTGIMGLFMLQMLLVSFDWISLAMTVVMIAIAVFIFLRKDRIRTEYEYTFTNGDLDYAMVFNNEKRKSLGTMKVKNVEAFGPVDSNEFRKLINMPGLKRRNWFLNRDAELYYFYYQKESTKNMIVFEPSAELVDMVRKYLPQGAYRA